MLKRQIFTMDKKYNPKTIEKKWYQYWLKKGYFQADNKSKKKPFVMIMPPVNLTGELHLGHVLQHTITDVLIRTKRMQGFDTLWLPGVDHAGIQMQGTMEKKLQKEEGKTREELGREKFLKYIWQWARIYEKKILEQSQRLGESADWSRKTFTLDPGPVKAVEEEFIRLYNKGLIYKGPYIVHWCPRCATAITELELEYKEQEGKLYYIEYPLLESRSKSQESRIIVATTRPETMLGDTAVAVNPKDKRYEKLTDKKVILPLINHEIPIIADETVDPYFGTGAVKVTPAHDINDYQIGERHKLPMPIIIDREGKMINVPQRYEGLAANKARELIIQDLKQAGYLKKIENIKHNVAICERCKSTIEPLISVQWFVKMKTLAAPAIEAIKKEKVKFLPGRYKEQALNWLENIHDWCISRQLVWGHKMPVYYCGKNCPPIISRKKPKKCPKCGNTKIIQETDVLDTWFSSGLWPFSTLGWPQKTADLKKYYPSDIMVTAPEIIYLWICRMIILGVKFIGDVPFKIAFIHGTLRDEKGQKMSKSLGNGIDPLEMVDKYSADALRWALAGSAYPGRDISMSKMEMEDKIRAARNFTTKIYNAVKLIIENTQIVEAQQKKPTHLADRWIYHRLYYTVKKVTHYLEGKQIAYATHRLYKFFWNELCDWYLEIAKERIYSEDKKRQKEISFILRRVICETLKLLHPFMPFITEELYHALGLKDDLIVTPWPILQKEYTNHKAQKEFKLVREKVIQIRTQKKSAIKLSKEGEKIVKYLTRNIK